MKYIIDKCEQRATKAGTVLKVDLIDENGTLEDKVTIWNSYPNFASLRVGTEVSGDVEVKKNGIYTNKTLISLKTSTLTPPRGTGTKVYQERQGEMIKVAQERKSESIAFFNSTNSAISVLKEITKDVPFPTDKDYQLAIVRWRDWFLSEWTKYEKSDITNKHDAF